MGVQFADIAPKQGISLEDLNGRKIAIDALNSLYQFLSIIRQPDGMPLMDSAGRITSHLSGLLYRTSKLVEVGVKPAYVFDGKPPEFKKRTAELRKEIKEGAKKRWDEALERGDLEGARKAAQATSRVNEKMLEESKLLLECMGIPVVQAPSEGEAQAAYMSSQGAVWAAASQDYDLLLFGSPRMIKNLAITGKRKLPRKETYIDINPELIELENVLSTLGLGRDQLIIIGILMGTDYDVGGIKGFGPKKALSLVREKKTLKGVFSGVKWDFPTSPEEISEFFLNPPTTDEYNLVWQDANEEKVRRLMVDEHNFSEERVNKVLETLRESRKKSQSSLGTWFKK